MIRTPADLTAYLKAVALAHPAVRKVITGDDIRFEEATLTKVEYPCVDIETPSHRIPIGEGPATLTTRIFVYNLNPGGKAEHHDINQDISHGIALSICACIKEHTEIDEYGIILVDDLMIEPRMHYSSDGVSGWVVPISVQVDQRICMTSAIDPDSIILPQFKWDNEIDEDALLDVAITLEDTSIAPDGYTSKFYWREEFRQPEVAEVEDDEINLSPDVALPAEQGLKYRIITVWIEITVDEKQYHAYAQIDNRMTAGWSVPFVPELPV
ncbi:MAG TPA: hypothetical protein VFG10_19005 [Saprospiraceae bacterium]|nr:hypothetical protein [Saprospiraceae bacterium]